jgi:tape measure domain-containing protein
MAYQFTIRLVDQVSAVMKNVKVATDRVHQSTRAYQSSLNTVPKSIQMLEREVKILGKKQREAFDISAVQRYGREIDRVRAQIARMQGKRPPALGGGGAGGGRLGGGIAGMVGGYLAPAAVVAAIGYGLKQSVDTAVDYESTTNALKYASGSADAFKKNLEFVNKAADEMGLNLERSLTGFTQLTASLQGPMKDKAQDIFKGVSMGVAVLGLGAEKSDRVFTALSQIASKGKVQAEELRGQIGEALPGAFSIAAKAMGKTEQQLNKMLDNGEVGAKEFLPAFAKAMEQAYGPGMAEAMNSSRAHTNRFNNELFRTKAFLGAELLPTVVVVMRRMTEWLRGSVAWVKENRVVLGQWAERIGYVAMVAGTAYTMWKVWNAAVIAGAALQAGYAFVVGLVTVATGGWTAATTALSAAMWANPVGIVIALIIGLAAAVVYVWNRYNGFSKFLMGSFAVLKEFGSMVYDYMIAPLMAFGKVFVGAVTLDKDLIGQGLKDGVAAAQRIIDGGSPVKRIKEAYTVGAAEGANMDELDPMGWMKKKLLGGENVYSALGAGVPGGGKDGKGGAAGGDVGVQDQMDSVSGGREGIKNFHLNIGKLVEQLTVQTTTVREGANDIKGTVTDLLLSAVNDVQVAR